MNVLVIGGSGIVGTMLLPPLAEKHNLRVFDLHPPKASVSQVEYFAGDVCDPAALSRAAQGQDALVYLAMGPHLDHDPIATSVYAFDINVKGVHLALDAARRAGVPHAVYASSMSVYQAMDWRRKKAHYYESEDAPPDAQGLYGFTKRLGEEVCRNAVREWGMSVNALRLCFPTPDADWIAKQVSGEPTFATAATDVARLFLAALEFRDGFQAFQTSGDYEEKLMRMTKAQQLLNWAPLVRPRLMESSPEPQEPTREP